MDIIKNIFQLAEEAEVRAKNSNLDPVKRKAEISARGISINNPTEIKARAERMGIEIPALTEIGYERIIGSNDLLPIKYLQQGLDVAKSVGRITIREKRNGKKFYGTGFLVAPNILLTNNHVLPNESVASFSWVEFDYEEGVNGREKPSFYFEFQPQELFLTSPKEELDYTFVAVKPRDLDDSRDLTDFGHVRLVKEVGKVIEGENLTIVQHPSGGLKQIALRDNTLIRKDEKFLWYTTDTAPGSSGAMVLNDQWEVVALHHSGVIKKNRNGDKLRIDGKVWNKNYDSVSSLAWEANEGIRISKILGHAKKQFGYEN